MTQDPKKSTTYTVPIGPVHRALKEPVMFTFEMDGELVKSVDFAPGNAHRGCEWMGMRRNPVQILYLSERICGICGIVHSLTFALAVEQIADIEVPVRADYIRTIMLELERIQSHLLWAGVAAHELGFDSLFYLTWKVREQSLDLIERIAGTRIHYGMIQIGGVRRDIGDDQRPAIEQCLAYYRGLLDQMKSVYLDRQHDACGAGDINRKYHSYRISQSSDPGSAQWDRSHTIHPPTGICPETWSL